MGRVPDNDFERDPMTKNKYRTPIVKGVMVFSAALFLFAGFAQPVAALNNIVHPYRTGGDRLACNAADSTTYFGRINCKGYYSNQDLLGFNSQAMGPLYEGAGMTFLNQTCLPSSQNCTDVNIEKLIDQFQTDLNRSFTACDNPYSDPNGLGDPLFSDPSIPNTCAWSKKRAQGVSFIINTMLGKNGQSTSFNGAPNGDPQLRYLNGIQYAKDNFGKWSNIVRAYANGSIQGASVKFNNLINYPDGHINSATFLWGADTMMFHNNNVAHKTIVFKNPDGTSFDIKENCGNVTGNISPLVDFNNVADVQSTGASNSPEAGGQVQPGGSYELKAHIINNNGNDVKSPGAQLRVRVLKDSQAPDASSFISNINYTSAAVPVSPATTGPAGNNVNYGVNQKYLPAGEPAPSSPAPAGDPSTQGCGGQLAAGAKRWCWFYSRLNAAASDNKNYEAYQVFKFQVDPAAPSGSAFCFIPSAYQHSYGDPTNNDGDPYCLTVGEQPAKPYLKIYGNDVRAGGGFGGSGCSAINPTASIQTFDKTTPINQTSSTWSGASSQFAASALGEINQFYTAGLRDPTGPTNLPRSGIDATFGNIKTPAGAGVNNKVTPNASGFSGISNCITDFFSLGTNPIVGNLPIGPATIAQGQHQAYFFKGDVTIIGNIVYQNSGSGWGAALTDIPSLYVIVQGNIFIDKDVTELDGVYVAQPAPGTRTGGEIVTCGTITVTPSDCSKKLTINGAFIARQVRFKRTNGDLATGISNEPSSSPNIAETFNFSPEVFLSPLAPSLQRSAPHQRYDYITSLPPVL